LQHKMTKPLQWQSSQLLAAKDYNFLETSNFSCKSGSSECFFD